MQQLMWLLALLALPTAAGARGPSGVALVGLTHEYRSNPLGTDALHPRFGWKLVSARRNTMQSAYQIQVARDPIARRWKGKPDLGFGSSPVRRFAVPALWRSPSAIANAIPLAGARLGCHRARIQVERTHLLGNGPAVDW